MKQLLYAHLIMLAAVSVAGFLTSRMRFSEIDDKRDFIVVVSDAQADASYFWLTVTGCSADHTDDGVFCNQGWAGRSDREWRGKQTPVPFRDAPRGVLLRFDAVVTDRLGKAKASSSFITTRSLR
jgi:hypothetical protein